MSSRGDADLPFKTLRCLVILTKVTCFIVRTGTAFTVQQPRREQGWRERLRARHVAVNIDRNRHLFVRMQPRHRGNQVQVSGIVIRVQAWTIEPQLLNEVKAHRWRRTLKNPDDLLADSLPGDAGQASGVRSDRRRRIRLDAKPQPRREAYSPEHPQVVLRESPGGIANRADQASLQIPPPTHEIDDTAHSIIPAVDQRILEKPIDREIPPPRIVFGIGEGDRIGSPPIGVTPIFAERGHLDVHAPAANTTRYEHDAEGLPHRPGAWEKGLDLRRPCIGRHVVIFGIQTQQLVTHASASQVRDVAGFPQPDDHGHGSLAGCGGC